MTINTQRNALIALTIVLLVAAAAVGSWSFSSLDDSARGIVRGTGDSLAEVAPSADPLSDFDPALASRLLRGPLYDPPPPRPQPKPTPAPEPPPPPPPPKLELTLVGTIIGSAQSLAIIADADGNFDVKGAGEELEFESDDIPNGITVERIESEQVTLDVQGRSTTVTLNREKQARGGGGNRANNRRRNRP